MAVKQKPQEEDQAKPPRTPGTLSSFFGEFVLPLHLPRVVQGGGGWVFPQRKLQIPLVFPRIRKSNLFLLACHPLHGDGAMLGGEWLWGGGQDPQFPGLIPSTPEASSQKRSERRGVWHPKKGGAQEVSQCLLLSREDSGLKRIM